MTPEIRLLRQVARELALPVSAVDFGLECGLFSPEEALESHRGILRCMRRLMRDLEVNAAGAALIVRMRHEIETLQNELDRLRVGEMNRRATWLEGVWREMEE